ncbi:MAG: carboxymuconolactone decarboxylase family protein [Pseudomonadota bacterium]
MNEARAVSYEQTIPDVLTSLVDVHQVLEEQGFDRKLRHLAHLRASQINRCGFCIKMHIREAREDGETSERLDRVVVWDQVSDFSEAEKAALAWTEALTVLDSTVDLGSLRSRLRQHFTDKDIGILTATIAMINLWNRINVSKH